ncbi:MAG: S8 family serine peptidase [Acidimicrobiia bacterium]|nr:S8 family serine peptidase [Acidimicrobiia bacterium]
MITPRIRLRRVRLLVVALSVLSLTVMMLTPVAAVAQEQPLVSSAVLMDDDDGWEDASFVSEQYVDDYAGSLDSIVNTTIDADEFYADGFDGSGVTVALIDSGVVPVGGLSASGKVVNGLDISFESQADDLRYMDTYGHGTHLAGIIAGNDAATGFMGVAPGASILNVKVANHEGAVDVSQVIAAIDWVIQHRNDNGMNVRVLNLAYGTDGSQNWQVDPLAAAAERAWRAGIVVVVAAGNDGNTTALRNPAMNPYVIAVGASDSNSSAHVGDDFVATFSNCGTESRHADVLAPGRSIISLRNPGSVADVEHPEARIGDDLFLGSGTSQAAAVVSGAVALILDRHPNATPDMVKAALRATGNSVATDYKYCAQAGVIDLAQFLAEYQDFGDLEDIDGQSYGYADGSGSLELARGSHHVEVDGVVLDTEHDIFGMTWDSAYIAKLAANHIAWNGGDFNGTSWSGTSWSGTSWSGTSWSGTSWSGTSWSGTSWSDYVWAGTSWSGTSWSGTSWSGTSWSGTSWSGTSWSNDNWLGLSWG